MGLVHVDCATFLFLSYTCISGPAVEIAAIVSAPMESTILLNLTVSISDSSRDFSISNSFCSLMYFSSASLALVSLSSSDSYNQYTLVYSSILSIYLQLQSLKPEP